MTQPEFLPTTREEMDALGWNELDVLLVSGDAYVDSHSFAASLLGRWLLANGFRTGIISQPSWENAGDFSRMGRPRLFAGVTAGALDSLVAHYTAFRKKRGDDAYSPGGRTGLRPNRAGIVYTGLLRQVFPGLPVVAGGIEASLRRASHYDFWSDALRRSYLLDSKADALLYGMGEKTILALAELLRDTPARQRPADAISAARIPGSVYAVHPDKVPADAEELPSHEAILADPGLLIKATMAFERQMLQGRPCLVQRFGGRAVVFEPPAEPLSTEEMDRVYALPFSRRAHPSYAEPVPAVAMIEDSIASHRGCAGGCSFCSLALHQGRTIQSRSEQSILEEVAALTRRPGWRGSITDIGGPSSNMWNARCEGDRENCKRVSCLYPKRCREFRIDQDGQAEMLRRVAAQPGVGHLRVASGVRHDLALDSDGYMRALVGEFTGGQLKIAPEHIVEKVLRHMRKPPVKVWNSFIRAFEALSREADKEQYIVPYLMSAFPGCTDADMEEMASWLRLRGWRPQQVQCFIPTPGTLATAMFYAKQDADGLAIPVARTDGERLRQHRILLPDAEPGQKEARRAKDRPGAPERGRAGTRAGGRDAERRPRFDKAGFRPGGDRRPRPDGDRPKFGGNRFSPGGDRERPEGDGNRRPRPDGDRPRFGGNRFSPGGERPRQGGDRRPRPDGDRPKFGGGKFRSGSERPDIDGNRRPRPDGERPKFGGSRFSPGGDRPHPSGDRRPRPNDDRPRYGNARPGTGEDRPRRPFGGNRPGNPNGQNRGRSGPKRDGGGGFNKPGGFRGGKRGPGGGGRP